ncbi:MAG TPA: aminotransferase class IV [Longimicrobiales bacterium]|nr:aminotransferase class IV [Longimicrobiales bacterium]
MIVYCDGEFLAEERAVISIDDPGLLSGDGVFETALLHEGGFLRLRQHLERFAASARLMCIAAPPATDLDRIVRALVRRNALRNANIRITLTRGVHRPSLFVTARPADAARSERARAGWTLITARTRRPSVRSIPAQLKTLGRTYALLARHEAAAAGADDALLLNEDDLVCEGPTWNVFWRRDDALHTPALDAGVLAGVTRAILLEVASEQGLTVHEGSYQRPALDDADEIFATMTSVGIVPIRSLDARSLPPASPAADALRAAYQRRLALETASDPA